MTGEGPDRPRAGRPEIAAVIALVVVLGGLLVLVLTRSNAPGAAAGASHGTGVAAATASPTPARSAHATYFISPDGNDTNAGTMESPWLTMDHAATRLVPGDTLYARGGRYVGQSTTWPTSGTTAAPIRFQAWGNEVPVFDGAGQAMFVFFRGDVHDVIAQGLTVEGYAPVDDGVIDIFERAHHITLDSLTMVGNDGPERTDHLIYLGADQVHDIQILHNRLDQIGGGGIHIFHAPGPRNVTIEGNVITNCHWGVIITSHADGVRVQHNTFTNNDIGVEVSEAANVTILDNIAVSAPKTGVGAALWIDDLSAAPGLVEDYNLWSLPGGRPIRTSDRGYRLVDWRRSTSFSGHSLDADPRLDADLRPAPDSPAVGAASDGGTIGAD